jgi:hypothetical protein
MGVAVRAVGVARMTLSMDPIVRVAGVIMSMIMVVIMLMTRRILTVPIVHPPGVP